MEYTRKCPQCGKVLTYSRKGNLKRAFLSNSLCTDCKSKNARILPEEKKKRQKEQNKRYRVLNQDKIKRQKKKYREKNNDIIAQRNKEYRVKNKKIISKKNDKYREENKENINQKKKERYQKNAKKPIFRLNRNISGAISSGLKSKNQPKANRHWEDLVGYTIQDLKDHIESKFQDGMTWSNYGKNGWVIDHIIPQKFFKFNSTNDVEFKYCWSLNNLQPLWEKDNLEKSDKLILWGKEINGKKK